MIAILLFLIFWLPLVVFPLNGSFFEIPKVLLVEILIELLLLWSFFAGKFSFKKPDKHQLIAISAIFILSLIQTLLLRDKSAFFGNGFRLQGVFLLWNLLALFLIFCQLKVEDRLGRWLWVPFLVIFASMFFFGDDPSKRAVGLLGQPDALAATIIFFYSIMLSKVSKRLIWIPIIITLVTLAFTGSRSGAIAFVLESVFLLMVYLKNIKWALWAGLTIFLLSLGLPFLNSGSLLESRIEIWNTALHAGLSNPIFGWGFGNVTNALNRTSWILSNNVRFQFIDSSHNLFLDFWVEGGILGLGAILFLCYRATHSLYKRKNVTLLSAFLGLLLMFMFNPLSVVNLVELWWLLSFG